MITRNLYLSVLLCMSVSGFAQSLSGYNAVEPIETAIATNILEKTAFQKPDVFASHYPGDGIMIMHKDADIYIAAYGKPNTPLPETPAFAEIWDYHSSHDTLSIVAEVKIKGDTSILTRQTYVKKAGKFQLISTPDTLSNLYINFNTLCKYDAFGCMIVYSNNKTGYLKYDNANVGNPIFLKEGYAAIHPANKQGYCLVQKDKSYGVCNLADEGSVALNAKYDDIHFLSNEVCALSKGTWSFYSLREKKELSGGYAHVYFLENEQRPHTGFCLAYGADAVFTINDSGAVVDKYSAAVDDTIDQIICRDNETVYVHLKAGKWRPLTLNKDGTLKAAMGTTDIEGGLNFYPLSLGYVCIRDDTNNTITISKPQSTVAPYTLEYPTLDGVEFIKLHDTTKKYRYVAKLKFKNGTPPEHYLITLSETKITVDPDYFKQYDSSVLSFCKHYMSVRTPHKNMFVVDVLAQKIIIQNPSVRERIVSISSLFSSAEGDVFVIYSTSANDQEKQHYKLLR